MELELLQKLVVPIDRDAIGLHRSLVPSRLSDLTIDTRAG
jgi:hypothetical protein